MGPTWVLTGSVDSWLKFKVIKEQQWMSVRTLFNKFLIKDITLLSLQDILLLLMTFCISCFQLILIPPCLLRYHLCFRCNFDFVLCFFLSWDLVIYISWHFLRFCCLISWLETDLGITGSLEFEFNESRYVSRNRHKIIIWLWLLNVDMLQRIDYICLPCTMYFWAGYTGYVWSCVSDFFFRKFLD